MDAVSDRDFALDLLSDLSILMMHLSALRRNSRCGVLSSRFATWATNLPRLVIMPQKKNPDIAELVRGKTGGSTAIWWRSSPP
jgi:argininosuccinate lyase